MCFVINKNRETDYSYSYIPKELKCGKRVNEYWDLVDEPLECCRNYCTDQEIKNCPLFPAKD